MVHCDSLQRDVLQSAFWSLLLPSDSMFVVCGPGVIDAVIAHVQSNNIAARRNTCHNMSKSYDMDKTKTARCYCELLTNDEQRMP